MNIALFLKPKSDVAYIDNEYTIRQTLEKMEYYHYSSIPVIDKEGKYIGTISEGDLLWFIKHLGHFDIDEMSNISISVVDRWKDNLPIGINANIEDLISTVMQQNFVPVIDDRNMFIGIVTRQDIISYFLKDKK